MLAELSEASNFDSSTDCAVAFWSVKPRIDFFPTATDCERTDETSINAKKTRTGNVRIGSPTFEVQEFRTWILYVDLARMNQLIVTRSPNGPPHHPTTQHTFAAVPSKTSCPGHRSLGSQCPRRRAIRAIKN